MRALQRKAIKEGIATASVIGTSFAPLPNGTATRLKLKWCNCGSSRSVNARCLVLWHALVGREKKTYGYRERDEDKRAAFITQLAAIPVSQRVYVDESGMDERDNYGYGWCERGKRFEALKSGRRAGRANMIAAYCQQRLSAPFTVEGSCNRVVFETWLETCLIPTLEPGQVLILDNATFHHGGRIAQLIQAAGCSMLVFACLFARLEPN